MARFLYIFSYQTPDQVAQVAKQDVTEESCEALFIDAESAEQALSWGRQVSEEFVKRLFGGNGLSWGKQNFAHWVEAEPEKDYPPEVLQRVGVVACGTYPKFDGTDFGRSLSPA